jgi:hypothetical protein
MYFFYTLSEYLTTPYLICYAGSNFIFGTTELTLHYCLLNLTSWPIKVSWMVNKNSTVYMVIHFTYVIKLLATRLQIVYPMMYSST